MKNITFVILLALGITFIVWVYISSKPRLDEYNRYMMEDVYGHKGNGWACDINGIDINLNK